MGCPRAVEDLPALLALRDEATADMVAAAWLYMPYCADTFAGFHHRNGSNRATLKSQVGSRK